MKNLYNSLMLMRTWDRLRFRSRLDLENCLPVVRLRLNVCSFLLFVFVSLAISSAYAQAPVITYPALANPLTRGLGPSLLSVKVAFPASCANISVEIDLPDGVAYVPGSVDRTAGIGAQTITEDGGTANRPKFLISNATAGNDIEFTIARIANCGTGNGKDEIYVTSSCGNDSETEANENNYNILSPALSTTTPAAVTNATVGNTYSTSFTVTNGGTGCIETLRLYTLRPTGSVSSPVLSIGETVIPSVRADGDTLFYEITGANLPGGDNAMCNGDFLTFTESFTLVKCDGLITEYGARWGRSDNEVCQTTKATGLVNMATGTPNLTYAFSAPPITACATLARRVTMTITNSSAAGTGPASNILVAIGNVYAGAYFNYSYYIDPATVSVTLPGQTAYTVTGITRTNIANSNNAPTCAVGQAGMVTFNLPSDFVLPAGGVVTVQFDVMTCPETVCNEGVYDPGNMSARLTYQNQCASSSYTRTLGSVSFVPGIRLGGSFTVEGPAQVFAGSAFDYVISGTATITPGAMFPDSYYEYNIVLPDGVTLNSVEELLHGDIPLASSVLTGQNLKIRFHMSQSGDNISRSHKLKLNLAVSPTTCGPINLAPEFRTTSNPNCDTPIFITRCRSSNITAICANPCPTGGATPTWWEHKRITFGAPDNNNDGKADATGTVDTLKADRTHYRPGDVMRSLVKSVVSSNTVDGYTTWPYVYSEWYFGTGSARWIPDGTATVVIKREGQPAITLTGVAPVQITEYKLYKADWSTNAGLPGGFVYQAGDSVIVHANFKLVGTVSTSGNGTSLNPYGGTTKVEGTLAQSVYASQVPNPPSGNLVGPDRFSCFTPQYNYFLYGSQSNVSYNQVNNNGSSACNDFTIGGSIYTYFKSIHADRFFPYEYRPTHIPDEITYNIPIGWEYRSHSSARLEYNTSSGNSGTANISITPTVTGNSTTGTQVVYDFRSILGTPAFELTGTEGHQMFTFFTVRPTCNTPVSGGTTMIEKGHYAYYPNEAEPATYTIQAGNTLNYQLANRAKLKIQDNTGVVQGVASQHYWDIQVNNATLFNAPYVWLALDLGTSGVTIDRVELLPSNTVLTPKSFGTSGLWYEFASSIVNGNQAARIYFSYSKCSLESVKVSTGWNCSGYPTTDPTASSSCSEDMIDLQVMPQPSLVQLSMDKQPVTPTLDLCEEDYVEAVVNSALGANVDNPNITIVPPAGLNVILPFRVEYPLGSNTWQDVTSTDNSGNYIVNLEEHSGIGINGLPGTLTSGNANSRQAKIRVRYSTDCDFVSGSRVGFIVGGDRPCGGSVDGDGDYINSAPINITGVDVTGTAGLVLSMGNTTLTCSAPETMNLQIIPTGSPTIAGDVAVYTLPAGLAYVNESFAAGTNCTGCTIAVTAGTGGATVLTVSLPQGVSAGSSIQFAVGIRAADVENGCGNKTITGEMQRLVGGLSCGTVECAISKAVIGNTSQVVNILKPQLDVASITLTKSGDQVNYSIVVNNNGTADASAGYQLKIYCGPVSNNIVVATVSTRAISVGATDTYTGSYAITSCTSGSDMFAQIDSQMANSTVACNCGIPAVASTEAPLPVTLLSFKAIAEGQTALLTWVTTAEVNSDRFEVEQSLNGKTWNKVGTVPAKGNSAASVAYTFTDANPDNGQNLYRLRVIDRDGKFGLSTIVGLNFQVDAVKLFPSPVSDKLTMRAQDWDKVSDVEMYDSNGKVVYESHRGSSSKLLSSEINVKPFAAGVYMVRISRKNGVVTIHKIVVNR